MRAEKRFKEFEGSVGQTNEQYQWQVQYPPLPHAHTRMHAVMTLLQLFSLREHLLAVEKQRDAKAAEAAAWASRTQEVQEAADNQLSYQQIEIQVHAQLCH